MRKNKFECDIEHGEKAYLTTREKEFVAAPQDFKKRCLLYLLIVAVLIIAALLNAVFLTQNKTVRNGIKYIVHSQLAEGILDIIFVRG